MCATLLCLIEYLRGNCFADNYISDFGAQSIGDSLKSLTSLTELNLNCEWFEMYLTLLCVYVLIKCMCSDVQTTTSETLGHNLLVMVSSHSSHLQHCVWTVSVVYYCLWVNLIYLCGCTDNNFGDVGAQSILAGLKSLKSLTTLKLNRECCVLLCATLLCVMCVMCVMCVCVCVKLIYLCWIYRQ